MKYIRYPLSTTYTNVAKGVALALVLYIWAYVMEMDKELETSSPYSASAASEDSRPETARRVRPAQTINERILINGKQGKFAGQQ